MRAGDLDRKVSLQRYVEIGRTGDNSPIMDWAPVCPDVWASRTDLDVAEGVKASEVAAELRTVFEIYWTSTVAGINPTWRLVCEGREYQILGAQEIGRKEGLRITTVARAENPTEL